MNDMELVKRLAETVMDSTKTFVANNKDFAEVIMRRPKDVTRKLDMYAEQALDMAIVDEGIAAHVISEEIGERIVPAGSRPECTLLLDPVDGSNNVVAGIPYYCTSLALSRKIKGATFADVDSAAVASNCCGTFYASKGRGAFTDGRKISPVRREGKPAYAIYSYGVGAMPGGLIALQEDEDCIVRTMGSIALDICMVARGSFDAVVDTRSRVSGYDIMGAALILLEAGGHICRTDGLGINELPLNASGVSIVAASNQGLIDRLLTVLSLKKLE